MRTSVLRRRYARLGRTFELYWKRHTPRARLRHLRAEALYLAALAAIPQRRRTLYPPF